MSESGRQVDLSKNQRNISAEEQERIRVRTEEATVRSMHTPLIAAQLSLLLGTIILWAFFRNRASWITWWVLAMAGCCSLLIFTTNHERRHHCSGRQFLRHHQILMTLCAMVTEAGMLGFFHFAQGQELLFLGGFFTAVLSSGAYIFSKEHRLAYIWVGILGIPSLLGASWKWDSPLIAMIFLVYLIYLVRSLWGIDRNYREFVSLQLKYEDRSRRLYESERRYRLIMENSQDIIYTYEFATKRFSYMSSAVQRQLGYTPEEAMALPADGIMDRESFQRVLKNVESALQQSLADPHKGYFARYNFVRKDGSLLDMEVNASFMRNAEGQITGILSVCRDATQHAEIERQSELISLLLREFEDNASDWIWKIDAVHRLTYMSGRVLKLFHKSSFQEIAGIDILAVLRSRLPDTPGSSVSGESDRQRLDRLEARLDIPQPFRDILLHVWVDGRPAWWSITGKPLLDKEGNISGWQGVCRDVTKLQEQEEAIEWQANHDSLTGALNSYNFHNRLAQLFPLNGRRSVLVLVHFDRLKAVNTLFGSSVGDRILCQLTSRMEQFVAGRQGCVHRLRATDFVIFFANAPADLLPEISGLAPLLHQPMNTEARDIDVALRLGAVAVTDDMTDAQTVESNAELVFTLMKEAKDESPIIFGWELAEHQHRCLGMIEQLRQATSGDEFFPLYQPQIDVATGRTIGAETLIRWQSPVFGLVPPMEFIPLAERNGYILEIGKWILFRACMDAMKWTQPAKVAVNASAIQLMSSTFVPSVMEALEQSGLPISRLKVEITETAFIGDSEKVRQALFALRREGIAISLDDFGTGYASLAYLNQYPIDELKVDQSFVRTIGTRPESLSIVRSVIRLAGDLGFTTTAEGVETPEQACILEDLGCTHFQGYYFAKPIAFDAFQQRLQDESSWTESRHAPWRG